jgi:hypothetical protein
VPGVDDIVGVRLGTVVAAGVAVGVAPAMLVGDGGRVAVELGSAVTVVGASVAVAVALGSAVAVADASVGVAVALASAVAVASDGVAVALGSTVAISVSVGDVTVALGSAVAVADTLVGVAVVVVDRGGQSVGVDLAVAVGCGWPCSIGAPPISRDVA